MPGDASEEPEDDVEALEYGRWLFAQSCSFVIGAAGLGQIPATTTAEVAFAGRSNVGKSSLINALTGRSTLARISNTPGRTRQLNFFSLGERLMLADLPGYGYARAPKSEVERWTDLVNAYLRGRAPLRRACVLVDARHGLKDSDRTLMAMLDTAAVSYQVVLTKCDKVAGKEREAVLEKTVQELARHPAAHPRVAATSARLGTGVAELRAALAALVATDDRA